MDGDDEKVGRSLFRSMLSFEDMMSLLKTRSVVLSFRHKLNIEEIVVL